MISRVYSSGLLGLEAYLVEIELSVSYGLRRFEIVGLPDKAVEESKERVAAAIESSGFKSPSRQALRVLVSLAPADLKKEGSIYDLPIALAYLLATKEISFTAEKKIILGELGLDGKLRPIKGAISFAIFCKEKGFGEIILPKENVLEANIVEGIKVVGATTLKEAIAYLEGKQKAFSPKLEFSKLTSDESCDLNELSFIKGQELAKRTLEISAAGGHHLLMFGPPGAGKTLLAKALSYILPPLSFNEALEVTKIYSIAGLLEKERPLILKRPFRAPHHTASDIALIGGGNPPKPGEITLSHHGVLFLDEFPEFHRDVLESLRQPIEERKITISRAKHSLTFPASFTLVAAANPCPCGNFGNPENECRCSASQIQKYQRKLTGPLIDRIDLFVSVPSLKYEKLVEKNNKNWAATAREKINRAREIQKMRFKKEKTNSEMSISEIKKYCVVDKESEILLKKYVNSGKLSARGYHRVLKVARTIADLEGVENISFQFISEALNYRQREF